MHPLIARTYVLIFAVLLAGTGAVLIDNDAVSLSPGFGPDVDRIADPAIPEYSFVGFFIFVFVAFIAIIILFLILYVLSMDTRK